MQSVSSRIWTRVAVSISYDDNDYTTGTSKNNYDDTKELSKRHEATREEIKWSRMGADWS